MSHVGAEVAWIPAGLKTAIARVTAEDYRVEDFRFDRDLRLGRQVLFLLSHTEWTRRTTEQVEISRGRSVDTEVVVDVDLSYAVHSGLRPYGDRLWLPLFTVPTSLVRDHEPASPGSPSAGGDEHGRPVAPDPMTSLEVSDAAGARVPKVPQSEVQHWVAAALAELLAKRLPRDAAEVALTGRDELLLLAAAIRWLLVNPATCRRRASPDADGQVAVAGHGQVGATQSPADETHARIGDRIGDRIGAARAALRRAIDDDQARARPALYSRLGYLVDAVYGTTFVVVGSDRSVGPTSYTVRMPARRLNHTRTPGRWQTPRARLGIDLLTASANTDRLIRLDLPEGVTYLPRWEPGGRQFQPPASIQVRQPRVFGELRAVVDEVLGRPDRVLTRARQRLARMGGQQVDACLPVLEQYRVTSSWAVAGGVEDAVEDERQAGRVRGKLQELQDRFRDVVDATDVVAGEAALSRLRTTWDEGRWLPKTLQRRVRVNTDTPGVVHLRTTAAEGSVMRASPTSARLDLEVAVTESSVLDTARDTSLITMGLLAVVTALTLVNRRGLNNLDAQTLATVLVLFPAIQAGRMERPDRGSLRGLLAQSTYLLSLATVFPPVVLATALALRQGGPDPRVLAVLALAAQGLLHLVLRRRPPQELPATARPAALLLQTDQSPDLARLDRLRGRSCRTMLAEALLLGRESHAYVARDTERAGALEQLLVTLDGERDGVVARRGDAGGLLGLMRSEVGGQALTFVVHGRQVRRVGAGGPWAPRPARTGPRLLPVPFTAARLAPVESPAWIVEVLIGLPHGVLRRLALPLHPLTELAQACREAGFPILLVQQPSPPPVQGLPGQEWVRVRVSVPYVPGEDLSGLRRFYEVVDGLREARQGRPPCSVHVYVTPELATYEAPETAADEASRRGGTWTAAGPFDTRLASAVDVVGDDPGPVLPLALCAGARVGLVGDLLDVVAVRRPDVRLAGVTIALLHGLTVSFLYCSGARPDPEPGVGADPGAHPGAHPAIGLGALIRGELEGSDDIHVAVEAGDPGEPPASADAAVGAAVGVAVGVAVGADRVDRVADGGGAGRPERAGPLLRLQLRTPDRAGIVPTTLERVNAVLRAETGAAGGTGLDVWFALLRVVDGRSLQGRLGIWLPAGDWSETDWSPVTEDEQRFLPDDSSGLPLVEDDPALTVNLARVFEPAAAAGRPIVLPVAPPRTPYVSDLPDFAPPPYGAGARVGAGVGAAGGATAVSAAGQAPASAPAPGIPAGETPDVELGPESAQIEISLGRLEERLTVGDGVGPDGSPRYEEIDQG